MGNHSPGLSSWMRGRSVSAVHPSVRARSRSGEQTGKICSSIRSRPSGWDAHCELQIDTSKQPSSKSPGRDDGRDADVDPGAVYAETLQVRHQPQRRRRGRRRDAIFWWPLRRLRARSPVSSLLNPFDRVRPGRLPPPAVRISLPAFAIEHRASRTPRGSGSDG